VNPFTKNQEQAENVDLAPNFPKKWLALSREGASHLFWGYARIMVLIFGKNG